MAREWDENGKLVETPAQPKREWDESGKLVGAEQPVRALSLSGAKLSAPSQPTGILNKAENWLSDVGSDIREGTLRTMPGRVLSALGAKGTSYGNSPDVGDYMASPIQGPIRMAQGATQIPQGKIVEGAKNIGGGALDTMQIPGAFMGGPGVSKAATVIDEAIPSTARAGQNFQQVMQGARNVPINTATEVEPIVQRAATLSQRGANAPKIVGDLNKAIQAGPVNYEAGRDFASNAGRLSIMDRMSTSPTMKAQVKMLAGALDSANREAAVSAGLGPQYDAAMTEYRHAKQLGNVGKIVGGAAALYAAKQLVPHAAIQTAKALATAP